MWEAASRMVLTTTLPSSLHLPASLLRRTMNLLIFKVTTSVTLVSEITSTKMLGHLTKWSEVNNNNNNNKMVRIEPVSSKPGNRRRSAGEQIPQETRWWWIYCWRDGDDDDDGLPAYSHNDRIPPWHGEMSVMIKVGMCQCQIPTIHDKLQLQQLALVHRLFNSSPVLRRNISIWLWSPASGLQSAEHCWTSPCCWWWSWCWCRCWYWCSIWW